MNKLQVKYPPSLEEKTVSLLIRILMLGLFFLNFSVATAATSNDVVGMVLDLQGSGEILYKENSSKLQLLSYLKPQMQLKLAAGSKASLSLYTTHSVYQLTGPAVVDIAKDGLNMVQGNPPVEKSMTEKLVVAAATTNLSSGAYRMRGVTPRIALISPCNGCVLLDTNPVFSWEAVERTGFEITLQEQPDKTIATAKIDANRWDLPADLRLDAGKSYLWTITYASPLDGKSYSASGKFSIASAADTEQIQALKPSENADIEEWVMYAAMLQNRQISEEARLVWQQIAKKRPDLKKVQELAQ
jgi:hypothetical protein